MDIVKILEPTTKPKYQLNAAWLKSYWYTILLAIVGVVALIVWFVCLYKYIAKRQGANATVGVVYPMHHHYHRSNFRRHHHR